ncbi:MAG TPA: C13 family peptidase [Candidatus Lokiarchaeia archaeon]|nr:C13 family peptidase [Candidatus Lokiarchaeia archaeon]
MAESRKLKKPILATIIVILIGLNVVQFAYFMWLRPVVLQSDSPLQVSDVTGGNQSNYAGKTLTIDGYFVAGPNNHDILTQNAGDFLQNTIIPVTNFLKITGTLPGGLTVNDSGSRVLLKGVIQVDTSNSSITDIVPSTVRVLEKPKWPYYEYVYPIAIHVMIPAPTKYAVLISGGWDSDHAYIRYWNDLAFMYAILTGFYNYSASHIIVLYKDGTPEVSGSMPVNYSCTYANIVSTFTYLKGVMNSRDNLTIYVTNHGMSGALCLWNHDIMLPSDLAFLLNQLSYSQVIIVMEQCFSGCFVQDISGPKRVIMTAASSTESSWAANTAVPFDEFVYQFMMAVRQIDLLGDPVSSDTNHDGKVSMVEAFNYAYQMDSAPEHPQYDDNGDTVSHSGYLPLGGDGYTGASFYL